MMRCIFGPSNGIYGATHGIVAAAAALHVRVLLVAATLAVVVVIQAGTVHQLAQLLLPDDVVAVGNQILPQLGHGVGNSGIGLGGRRYSGYLYVQVAVEVRVLGILGAAQLLLLDAIAHGITAQDGHLAERLLLQAAQGVALWSQQLAHEIELGNKH